MFNFRMRKLERIAQLDSEVGQLKEQNMQLVKEGDCLRGELRQLKDILRFAQLLLLQYYYYLLFCRKHVESGECKIGEFSSGPAPCSP